MAALQAEFAHALGENDLDIRLDVPAGQCLALAGAIRPDRGRVTYGGEVWVDTTRGVCLPPERRSCGYVFQDYALFPHLSAWQNVAYGLRSTPSSQRRAAALALLERFGLAERAGAKPANLSGGERQRVALARALAPSPNVLLLDEPLSALDARTRARASRELAETLRRLEVPVVLVTHEFGEAALLGDEIGVIDRGRVIQRGSPSQIAAAPATSFVADFTGAVVLTGTVRSAAGELTVVDLDGGGVLSSTDPGQGRVALSVFPWEITLARPSGNSHESAQNRLSAEVTSVTTVGNRVRVGLAAGQPLIAEITARALEDLELAVGSQVVAVWKATATRLME